MFLKDRFEKNISHSKEYRQKTKRKIKNKKNVGIIGLRCFVYIKNPTSPRMMRGFRPKP